jgi:hypothetical protein
MTFVDYDDPRPLDRLQPPWKTGNGADLHRRTRPSRKSGGDNSALNASLIHGDDALPEQFHPMHPEVAMVTFFGRAFQDLRGDRGFAAAGGELEKNGALAGAEKLAGILKKFFLVIPE